MIHLDTNYLIGLITRDSPLADQVRRWIISGESLATSAIAWSEFRCGPVTERETLTIRQIIQGGVIPFGEPDAELAAELFNLAGRKRGLLVDSFIAALAIRSGAPLATGNQSDFRPFVPFGLKLT
jgi:predicted nucleic acid-binding protein